MALALEVGAGHLSHTRRCKQASIPWLCRQVPELCDLKRNLVKSPVILVNICWKSPSVWKRLGLFTVLWFWLPSICSNCEVNLLTQVAYDFEMLSAHILPGFYASPLCCWLPTDSSIYRWREKLSMLDSVGRKHQTLCSALVYFPYYTYPVPGFGGGDPGFWTQAWCPEDPHIAKWPSVIEQKANPCH